MRPVDDAVIAELQRNFPGAVATNVSMANYSNWRIGGKLAVLVSLRDKIDIVRLRRWLYREKIQELIIGNTTNLLFTDGLINAVGVRMNGCSEKIVIEGEMVVAQAGVYVPCLARKVMQNGLSGLEHACGIPATVGGLVVMNGGSQRRCVGELVSYVEVVTKKGEIEIYQPKDCGFSYRSSIFQSNDKFIVEVGLKLKAVEEKKILHKQMLKILKDRSSKFPRKQANCGSVFVSDPLMYEKYGSPGEVLEKSGLKGVRKGGAQISSLHANFIINNSGASSEDVLYLINHARELVFNDTGYMMKVEPKFVSSTGKISEI